MSATQRDADMPAAGAQKRRSLAPFFLGAGLVVPLAALATWLASGAPPSLVMCAAVIWIAIFLWASALVPEYITALILFFLAILTQIAPPSVVFSGLVLGLGVQQSGLAGRAVTLALRTVRTSYTAR